MNAYEILRLISGCLCGMQIGSFFLLSLQNRPLLENWPYNTDYLWLFKRIYRLHTVLTVIAGVIAILGHANKAGVILAILGMSYVIAHMHLLRAIVVSSNAITTTSKTPRSITERNLKTLKLLQQLLHLLQIFSLIYAVYLLAH